MYNLILNIEGLTIEEREVLLKKIEIIKYNILKEMNVEYSMLKHSPNWIRIDEDIKDMEKALLLFKLLSNLNMTHEYDEYYEIYETPKMDLKLIYKKEWE